MHKALTSAPGLYAFALRLPEHSEITVGALGTHTFPAGHYVYVGSAWGAGGLAARVGRHLRGESKRHWHIDYLRAKAEPVAIWWAENVRDECAWATGLLAHPGMSVVVPRFGASDCDCAAHLAHIQALRLPAELFPAAQYLHLNKTERDLL